MRPSLVRYSSLCKTLSDSRREVYLEAKFGFGNERSTTKNARLMQQHKIELEEDKWLAAYHTPLGSDKAQASNSVVLCTVIA